MNKKILITDTADTFLANTLSENGFVVDYQPDISQEEVEKVIAEYEGIIITTKISLNKNILLKAGKLEFIARAGSGMDHVDVAFARERGIECITSPEANAGSVGEHCVGMLLAVKHNIVSASASVKEYKWETDAFRVNELRGITVGIIGYGNTGPEFAKRIKPFGVRVIAYDKYRKNFNDEFAEEVTMSEVYNEADVFSIHLPLTSETNNLVNIEFLRLFKKPVLLINTSRGHIVNLSDLLIALDEKKVSFAALDVVDNEIFSSHSPAEINFYKSLFQHEKIIVTPHIAGKSTQTRLLHAKVLTQKILERCKL